MKGIIIDWSDAEAKGLIEAVGNDVANNVLKGCIVHWTRSYQRVAERVNLSLKGNNKKVVDETFCKNC